MKNYKLKILCPEPNSFSPIGLSYASKYTDLIAKELDQKEFERQAINFDAVLIRFNKQVKRSMMKKNSKLKYILSPTTGIDHIDINFATKKNIKIFSLKNKSNFLKKINASSEHTLGLILSLLRKIPFSFEDVKKNRWNSNLYIGNELFKKSIGIIGYGRIGKKVAKYCLNFKMKVNIYDPFINKKPNNIHRYYSLFKLLENSNIISLHVPLNKNTHNLIGKNEFKKIKAGSYIINTSRGAIINNSCLLENLKKKKLSGAALDVLTNEKKINCSNNALINYAKKNRNLIITPHIAGSTLESIEMTDLFLLKNFFLELNKTRKKQ